MPYTNILRMCLSGLRRIPGQVAGSTHLMGQCQNLAPSRLLTVRRYGALAPRISINTSQHGLFCTSPSLIRVSNTQINRYSVASEKSQESRRERREYVRIRQDIFNDVRMINYRNLVEKGHVLTLEPRIVTSLPEKFKRTGNETFVTFNMTVIGKFPNIELFTIHTSSGSDNFHQVCKTTQEVPESLASTDGMVYNENTDQFLRDGKPVELTGPKEALQQFIGFLKKHNKPVLVFYGSMDINNLSLFFNKWGLLDDFLSEVPYCFSAIACVEKAIAKEDVEDLKLATICEKLMGLKLKHGDQIKRMDALHRLFTEHLQEEIDGINPLHTNKFYTRNSLIKMVVDNQMHVITLDKLSNAGIGLDQLNFLAENGYNEFVSYLVDIGIIFNVAERLYSVFEKEKNPDM